MKIEKIISECTAYDFKVMFEEKKPKSWLKSRSNGLGGSLFDYMEKRGSGLTRICNETQVLEGYKDNLKPSFNSTTIPNNHLCISDRCECRRRNLLSISRKYQSHQRVSYNNRQTNVGDFVGKPAYNRARSFYFAEA